MDKKEVWGKMQERIKELELDLAKYRELYRDLEAQLKEKEKDVIQLGTTANTLLEMTERAKKKIEKLEAQQKYWFAERNKLLAYSTKLEKKLAKPKEAELIKDLAIYRTSQDRDKHMLPEAKAKIKELLKKLNLFISESGEHK